jgi:hypothetical protein
MGSGCAGPRCGLHSFPPQYGAFWHPRQRLTPCMRATFADHYQGITENWDAGLIYCSEVTARLIIHMLGVNPTLVRRLPMDTPVSLQGAPPALCT